MSLKKRFVRYKVYLDRSRQYSIYAVFFMQGATWIGVFATEQQRTWLREHAIISTIIGITVVLIAHLAIGRLEYVLGLFSEESRRHSETNPVTLDIIERLKRIEEKIK